MSDRRFDVIGHLEVYDKHGNIHRVDIRREDLTTTNAGYRAARDAVTETLALVLDINRS